MMKKIAEITEIVTLTKSDNLKTVKDINFKFLWHKLKIRMKIVSKFHLRIFNAFRDVKERCYRARPGRFIVLNYSASDKMVIRI